MTADLVRRNSSRYKIAFARDEFMAYNVAFDVAGAFTTIRILRASPLDEGDADAHEQTQTRLLPIENGVVAPWWDSILF